MWVTAYVGKRSHIHATSCVFEVQTKSKSSFNISAESLPKRLLQKQLTLMSKSIEADVKCMSYRLFLFAISPSLSFVQFNNNIDMK